MDPETVELPAFFLHTIRHVYRSVWPAREVKPRLGAALVRSAHDCETRVDCDFRVVLRLCFKESLSAKPYIEIFFIHLQILVHLHVNKTYFHMKGFALVIALKQKRKVTGKWAIDFVRQLIRALDNWPPKHTIHILLC